MPSQGISGVVVEWGCLFLLDHLISVAELQPSGVAGGWLTTVCPSPAFIASLLPQTLSCSWRRVWPPWDTRVCSLPWRQHPGHVKPAAIVLVPTSSLNCAQIKQIYFLQIGLSLLFFTLFLAVIILSSITASTQNCPFNLAPKKSAAAPQPPCTFSTHNPHLITATLDTANTSGRNHVGTLRYLLTVKAKPAYPLLCGSAI